MLKVKKTWDCLSTAQQQRVAAAGLHQKAFRPLRKEEIASLQTQGNTASAWSSVWIDPQCDLRCIRGCRFLGEIYIGKLSCGLSKREGLKLEFGLYDSVFCNCILAEDVAVHNVKHLENYLIHRDTGLFCIDEMRCDDKASFGWGLPSQHNDTRLSVQVANENGKRAIAPFEGMLPSDAALWSKRADRSLSNRFWQMVEKDFPHRSVKDEHLHALGEIGCGSWLQSVRVLRNVTAAPGTSICASNILENLSINSSLEEPTILGEGVILQHGCIGKGCRVLSASQAIRFVLGDFCEIKNAARILDSFLGDHSAVACCEMRHNYVGPLHVQHHNNSFLISASLEGQSNLAAGALFGSNHNSRRADGEFVAERGLWAGLGSLVRYNSRCAAFTFIHSGNYSSELHIIYPFSLVAKSDNVVTVRPAYWFTHNLYALERNQYKFQHRSEKGQRLHLTLEYLAPDTALQMYVAAERLAELLQNAKVKGLGGELWDDSVVRRGRSKILKAAEATQAYSEMICYFIGRTVLAYLEKVECRDLKEAADLLDTVEPSAGQWVSMGGQIFPLARVEQIYKDVQNGVLDSWQSLHSRYSESAEAYPVESLRTALWLWACIPNSTWGERLSRAILADLDTLFRFCRQQALQIEEMCRQHRQRDLDDPHRTVTYFDAEEKEEVLGTLAEDDFLISLRSKTEHFCNTLDRYLI